MLEYLRDPMLLTMVRQYIIEADSGLQEKYIDDHVRHFISLGAVTPEAVAAGLERSRKSNGDLFKPPRPQTKKRSTTTNEDNDDYEY